MRISCRLALAAMAAACFFQLPAHAAELFVADAQAKLWRYGAETEQRIYVGDLPATFVGLSFSEDGELYGIAIDGQVWAVNPQTAATTRLAPGRDTDRYQYRDLFHHQGDLLLLRWDRELDRSELTRLNLATGDELLLGGIINGHGDPAEPLNAQSFLPRREIDIYLVDSQFYYDLSLRDLRALPFEGPFASTAATDMAIDYEAERYWAISEATAGEPGLVLVALDGRTLEIDADAPFYRFPFGEGPRSIALVKDPDNVCPQESETLCLQDSRFRLRTAWRDFSGNEGAGHTVLDRSETAGQFWFFAPENHELLIKVINGCAFNGHYWVFFAGTTNVEFTVTVTDLSTAAENFYSNALGDTAQTRLDTTAFLCQVNDVSEDGI